MPEQRAFGFFAFAACALIAILVTAQWSDETPPPEVGLVSKSTVGETQHAGVAPIPTDSRQARTPAESLTKQSEAPKRERARVNPTLGVVAFQSRSFVTSERAVAAVFILKRTQVVNGRALVHWTARSGSADAGIDFSDASGTVRFADGQRQVAIYVPLRNDLLKEQNESFKVCLRPPQQARIAGRSCAEVTILDDDHIAPT